MHKRRIALLLLYWALPAAAVLAFSGIVPPCYAADEDPPDRSMERVEQRILELERRIEEMQKRHAEEIRSLKGEIEGLREARPPEPSEEDELAQLRRLAESEAEREGKGEEGKEETTFQARGLSLQALNPEISITGDMYAFYRNQEGTRERSGFKFRGVGLHVESYLDPYSRFKVAIPFSTDGAELGEAYMTRYGIPGGLNLTFGKFRQQFGVVNRWHKHGLDQFDFPLPLRRIFGDGGLNQIGVSLDKVLPRAGKTSQELTFQLTNGENPSLFSGNTLGTPSVLLHYKNYRDISKDTYFEFGLSSLLGWRDSWDVELEGEIITEHHSLATYVYGMDISLLWEPTERMRYRNLVWRTELYVLDRAILAPDGSGRDTIDAWGAYTYVQSKINRRLDIGTRFDYFAPDTKDYVVPAPWLAPHAFPFDVTQWQLAPYITWQQSPWVRWRVEFNHLDSGEVAEPEDIVYFQLIFAAGPHKHERY